MKRTFSFIIFLVFILSCFAQSFSTHIVDSLADGARDVWVADMDGDTDQDIIVACGTGDKVSWYEYISGQSFTEHIISDTINNPYAVFAIDLDKDGYMDVLSAASNDDQIIWHKQDNNQAFTAHVISSSMMAPEM